MSKPQDDAYELDDDVRLVPVIVDKFGNLIDGNTRLSIDEEWPVYTSQDVDTPLKLAYAQLKVNLNRRIVEKGEISEKLANIYERYKEEVGEYPDAVRVAEGLYRSERWVLKYLPSKYKTAAKANAGEQGGIETAAHRAAQELDSGDLAKKQEEAWESAIYAKHGIKHLPNGAWRTRRGTTLGGSLIFSDTDYKAARREIEMKTKPKEEPKPKQEEPKSPEDDAPAMPDDKTDDFELPPPIDGPVGTAHDDTTINIEEVRKSVTEALTALEEASPIEEKKAPYGKGLSPVKGSKTEKVFTASAMKLKGHLHDAGLKDFIGEKEFAREGELNRDGKQKFFQADLYSAERGMILEPEGKGSKSHDNPERDEFFRKKGIRLIHIPNALILDYGAELAEMIADFLRPMDTPKETA